MRLPDYASAQSDILLVMYKLEPGNNAWLRPSDDTLWNFDPKVVEEIKLPCDTDIEKEWSLVLCHTYNNQKYYYIKEN